jgi:glycosyltransferase involved in cell wall biosynthesis
MLEAMAAGCVVVGSSTAPVLEVVRDGENGLLVDLFSPSEIARRVEEVLCHPDRMQTIRDNARQTIVGKYDLATICLPKQIALIDDLVRGRARNLDTDRQRFDGAQDARASS